MRDVFCLSLLIGGTLVSGVIAEDAERIPADRRLGLVYGKAITAGDVGLESLPLYSPDFDGRDSRRSSAKRKINAAFRRPLSLRFIADNKLEATPAELAEFHEVMQKKREPDIQRWQEKIKQIDDTLTKPELSDREITELKKQKLSYQEQIQENPWRLKDSFFARAWIVSWKADRELQRQYGGKIVIQEFGPQAFDARRKFYEAAENRGDLKFDDPAIRNYFYHEFRFDLPEATQDALETPWFLPKAEEKKPQ